jgi:hypothetical protein
VRIKNISLKFNLVSSSSCGHQKRIKKIKKEREEEEEELENHCMCSCEELRRKKKNGEREIDQEEN